MLLTRGHRDLKPGGAVSGLAYFTSIETKSTGMPHGTHRQAARKPASRSKADFKACFETGPRRFLKRCAATPAETLIRTDICDRPPLARWGRGRVTLLGDAAHPTTPNLGQGACMAIEDAVVLAQCLSRYTDHVAALRAYEDRRRARTANIVRASRRMGWVGQWQKPACLLVARFRPQTYPPTLCA